MKKTLLCIVCFFLSVGSIAQSNTPDQKTVYNPHNKHQISDTVFHFYVRDNDIVWQRVYECPNSPSDILARFSSYGLLAGVSIKDNVLRAQSTLSKIDLNSKGSGSGSYATFMGYPYDFDVQIEARNGRYRVTLSHITFYPKVQIDRKTSLSAEGSNFNIKQPLTDVYFFNRKRFTPQFRLCDSELLDEVLSYDFNIANTYNTFNSSNDW